jgi:predicted secreted hydrolase
MTRVVLVLTILFCAILPVQAQDYARALPGIVFEFPRDHGAHRDFRTEWWYLTGNLESADGDLFGYQFTIFRSRLVPPGSEPTSPLFPAEILLGHFAISDKSGKTHHHWERLGRPGLGQASASDETLDVNVGDWRLWFEDSTPGSEVLRLEAGEGPSRLSLTMRPSKPLVIHGQDGVHIKGEDADQASHYLSWTRLETEGELTLEGKTLAVSGLSWKDHEFGSAWLGEDEIGWDWFALQFEDGTDAMIYRLRRRDGTANPNATGTIIEADGSVRKILKGEYELQETRWWQSPETNARYPVEWRIRIPEENTELVVAPVFDAQEMRMLRYTGAAYYEGAITVSGTWQGVQAQGRGYMELVGYARPMEALSAQSQQAR